MLPPPRSKILRTSPLVRLRLSVRTSTSTATPPGPKPSYTISSNVKPSTSPVPRLMDVVVRHRYFACLVDGVAQFQIHRRIAAAVAGRNDDGSTQLAPQFAAL